MGKDGDMTGVLILAAVLLVVCPLVMGSFRLNLLGKYLTYAFVALGLVVCWGQAGILSLGSGGVLRPRRLLHGHVPEARGVGPA